MYPQSRKELGHRGILFNHAVLELPGMAMEEVPLISCGSCHEYEMGKMEIMTYPSKTMFVQDQEYYPEVT